MPKHKTNNQKHWYKRWWAIILFIIVGLYILSSIGEQTSTNETNQNVNTPSIEQNNRVVVQQPKQEEKTLIKEIVSEDKTLEEYQIGKFTRDFEWNYNRYTYQITLNLYPEVYKIFKSRERTRDFDLFASDFYSKEYIKAITEGLRDYGKNNVGLSDAEIPYFIISFVQNLPYTSDDVTTGFDEYPRFPYETFYDNGGDCEDTSILASAMLYELGYGVALLQFPEHMAVGVKCSPSAEQSYYTYYGIDYCYLETTGQNWEVGAVPPNIKSSKAIVKPLVERPALAIEFTSKYKYDWKDVYTDVDVKVKNLGSETAKNTKIYVALQTTDTSKVWVQIQSDALEIKPEETYSYKVTNLYSPTGQPFRIYVRAWGDNVISDESVSNWIYWK